MYVFVRRVGRGEPKGEEGEGGGRGRGRGRRERRLTAVIFADTLGMFFSSFIANGTSPYTSSYRFLCDIKNNNK